MILLSKINQNLNTVVQLCLQIYNPSSDISLNCLRLKYVFKLFTVCLNFIAIKIFK